jgi:hypothetical protein
MTQPRHSTVTAVWVTLYLLPVVAIALVWLLWGHFWGLVSLVLYLLLLVPYGFFVSMPVMIKLFREPTSLRKR